MNRAFGLHCVLLGLIAAGCAPTPPGPEKESLEDREEESGPLSIILKWPPFPPERDPIADMGLTDVRYDLRIYQEKAGCSRLGEPFYSRDGLDDPAHRVEEPLDPNGNYIWTVRATFRVMGSLRRTPWVERIQWPRYNLLDLTTPFYLPLPPPSRVREEKPPYSGRDLTASSRTP